MTPDQLDAIMWSGITPPSGTGSKTTCPMCSHTRRKAREKCLRLSVDHGLIFASCYHCGWETSII